MIDSTNIGIIQPEDLAPPLFAGSLDDFLQAYIADLLGLDRRYCRPRYQPEPVNLPRFGTDWVAVGVMRQDPVGFVAAQIHDPAGDGGIGVNNLQDHETFELLCSFYGPNAGVYAGLLRQNLMIGQNREWLTLNEMGIVEVQPAVRAAELINHQWWDRFDRTIVFQRLIRRTYPIRTLKSFQFALHVQDQILPYTTGVFVTPAETLPSTAVAADISLLDNYIIPSSASGTYYDNNGAPAEVVAVLPPWQSGLTFSFTVANPHLFVITAQGLDQIAVGPINSVPGGNISSATPFSFLQLHASTLAGQWLAVQTLGPWSVTT